MRMLCCWVMMTTMMMTLKQEAGDDDHTLCLITMSNLKNHHVISVCSINNQWIGMSFISTGLLWFHSQNVRNCIGFHPILGCLDHFHAIFQELSLFFFGYRNAWSSRLIKWDFYCSSTFFWLGIKRGKVHKLCYPNVTPVINLFLIIHTDVMVVIQVGRHIENFFAGKSLISCKTIVV